MAISKRLRFEILRRDNHSCRYCGEVAPTAVLTVDHVVPQALGGSDEPSNLVAACKDCNSGKTSTSPDSVVVDDVRTDALRWAAAVRQAAIEAQEQHSARREVFDAVARAWPQFRQMPSGWESSIGQFLDAGLSAEVILEMVGVANAARGVSDRWVYFCGCCWTRVRQLQDRALEILSAEDERGEHPSVSVHEIADYDIPDLWLLALYGLARSGYGELPPCSCSSRDDDGAPYCGDLACMLKAVVLAAREWSAAAIAATGSEDEAVG